MTTSGGGLFIRINDGGIQTELGTIGTVIDTICGTEVTMRLKSKYWPLTVAMGAMGIACSESPALGVSREEQFNGESEEREIVRLPVFAFCDARVLESLECFAEGLALSGNLVRFDEQNRSDSRLSGFIEITSSQYSRLTLLSVARDVTRDCSLDYEATFDKTEPADNARFFAFLNSVERGNMNWQNSSGDFGIVDPYSISIVNEEGVVRVLFNVDFE
jgi:hypothetical protein